MDLFDQMPPHFKPVSHRLSCVSNGSKLEEDAKKTRPKKTMNRQWRSKCGAIR